MPRPAPHATSRCDAPNAADNQPVTGSFPAIRRIDPPGNNAGPWGFHHIALSVKDRDSSTDWYASVLGFEEVFREDSPERRVCVMCLPGGAASVGVVEHVRNAHEAFDPRRRGLDHLAFAVRSLDELERWAARLAAADIAHSGVIPIPRGAILNFEDPDGIALALFWDGPQRDSLS